MMFFHIWNILNLKTSAILEFRVYMGSMQSYMLPRRFAARYAPAITLEILPIVSDYNSVIVTLPIAIPLSMIQQANMHMQS